MQIEIRRERKRGCGYRSAGKDGYGLYFVGGMNWEPCERLPFPLTVCPCCGAGIKFSRGFTWIEPGKLFAPEIEPICMRGALFEFGPHRHKFCAMCNPVEIAGERAGLMWVGEKFYPTPEAFIREGAEMGVCKRINAIPRGFEIGKTWIYLAHNRAVDGEAPEVEKGGLFKGSVHFERVKAPGIFAAFRPERLEVVVNDPDPDKIPERAQQLFEELGEHKCKIVVVEPIEETEEVSVGAGH